MAINNSKPLIVPSSLLYVLETCAGFSFETFSIELSNDFRTNAVTGHGRCLSGNSGFR